MSYAILGWCMEVTCKLIEFKRFINRGFLIGPYCPIYGWGAILITVLLKKYTYDPLVLFTFAIIICTLLEYITSYVMEKIFHARWWDYSLRKFNINGRVCLETMIPFGLLGLLMMYFINPLFIHIYESIPTLILTPITIVILTIYVLDNIISTSILISIRKDNKILDKDNTEEMVEKVHEIIRSKSLFHRRISNAYPNVRHIGTIMKDNLNKKKKDINYKREKIIQKRDEQIAILKYQNIEQIKKLQGKTDKKLKKYNKK